MGLRALTRLLVVLLIAVGGAAVGWYLSSGGLGAAGIKQTTDLPAVVQQIRELSELVTVKYTVQKVVGLEEKKTPFGTERLLLIVQAEVLGGVELAELREADIARTSDGGVRIAMPTARVLHVVLNENETKVWDRDITWWTPWVPANPDLERQARLQALESIKETAFEMGIHEDARRNAEDAIRGLLEAAGVSPVLFVEGSS